MELFSELYSCYYQVVARILRSAGPLSRRDISGIVEEHAFAESGLYLLPRLCGGEWELLEETPEGYVSKVEQVPKLPLTCLQSSWLKAVLSDPRARLFLTDGQLESLDAFLTDPPLFPLDAFRLFDVSRDGDDYGDPGYRIRFRRILSAVKEQQPLRIRDLPKGGEQTGDYLPCKLEYSQKDDKFRLYAARLQNGGVHGVRIINLGRIIEAEPSREPCREAFSLDDWLRRSRCREPVRLRIYRERNALERCMLLFASYEKQTEYDPESDTFLCTIFYDRLDETELLIRILSFGPVVRVLGPESFLRKIRGRVQRQARLLEEFMALAAD